MNILSKLFQRRNPLVNNTPTSQNVSSSLPASQMHIPDEELFVESEKPLGKTVQSEQPGKISLFLNKDFHSLGVRDGFEYRSSDQLAIGKRKIGAEFRLILEREIQERVEKQLELENLIVDVSSISELTLRKLQNTLQRSVSVVNLLEQQKELSIEEEGWVMNAVYSYQQGFSQGVADYIAGETLLNSIKNF